MEWACSSATVVDVRIALVDGSFHDVDSSEMAFKIAGSMAFRARCSGEAQAPRPVVAVEVVTPTATSAT